MNERILELALQARLGPALLLHHWGTVDALTDSEQDGLEQIEKFARLIMRECIDINNQELSFSAFERLLNRYNEHFGVSE